MLALVVPAVTVLAGPPALPASFYGRAWVSGSSAPANSSIFVYTGEVELAHVAVTQDPTFGAVYAINVPADNPDTLLIEGGNQGDILTFYIQLPDQRRVQAPRTAVWSSGANVSLDLNFSAASRVYLPMIANSYRP